ncbi:MAG: P-loop NTPase [Paracoccaceae bacterium]
MSISNRDILRALGNVSLPGGGDLASSDMVRALAVEGDSVRFVIEVSPEDGPGMEPVRAAAESAALALPGIERASVVLTAETRGGKPDQPPPDLGIGRHPTPPRGPEPIEGVDHIIAVASGKGGVGKSTVSANLAVALARAGRRVGLLDADIYGPSQHRMMGMNQPLTSSDGTKIEPLIAHGVTFVSMGLMMKEDEAVIWRGPMLMGALQQLLGQVEWGSLDALIVDLPPGTGDVQLTLAQKTKVTGAVVVSTPQDIALLDARRAINMFQKTNTPILGMIENMSVYVCPNCGHEDHLFGHGGARADAKRLGLPFLGEIPLSLDIREAGDAGRPVALGDGPAGKEFAGIAAALVANAMA